MSAAAGRLQATPDDDSIAREDRRALSADVTALLEHLAHEVGGEWWHLCVRDGNSVAAALHQLHRRRRGTYLERAVAGGQLKLLAAGQAERGAQGLGNDGRGVRGFSLLVQKALAQYLSDVEADELDLLLSLEGTLSDTEEKEVRARVEEVRKAWRTSSSSTPT